MRSSSSGIIFLAAVLLMALFVFIFILCAQENYADDIFGRSRIMELAKGRAIIKSRIISSKSWANRDGRSTARRTLLPRRIIHNVSCSKLREGELFMAANKAILDLHNLEEQFLNDSKAVTEFLEDVSRCDSILPFFQSNPITDDEKNYPLAFTVIAHLHHRSIQQYISLLRQLYSPHNAYCLYLNDSTPKIWKRYINKFASCFSNMIIVETESGTTEWPSHHEDSNTHKGHEKIFEAQLSCYKRLVVDTDLPKWNYVLTLDGTELPLVTNGEIVESLRQLNNVNVIDHGIPVGLLPDLLNAVRIDGQQDMYHHNELTIDLTLYTSVKSSSPFDIALTRDFIEFLFRDIRATSLAKYLKSHAIKECASQCYFVTLNHLPEAPGGISKEEHNDQHETTSFPVIISKQHYDICLEAATHSTTHVTCTRGSSPGINDLEWMIKLFNNDYHPVAVPGTSSRPLFVRLSSINNTVNNYILVECMYEHIMNRMITRAAVSSSGDH